MSSRNYNHNVRISRDPEIIPVIILGLIAFWAFRGYLSGIFAAVFAHGDGGFSAVMESQPQTDGFASVTYLAITMLWQAVGVGVSYLLLLWAGILWLARDVMSAISRFAADRADQRQQDTDIGNAVATQSVVATQGSAEQPTSFGAMTTDAKIEYVARDSRKNIAKVEAKVDKGFADLVELIQQNAKPTTRRKPIVKAGAKS